MDESNVAEFWLPVAGFEGSYEVSDHGRVRSRDRVINARDGRSWRHAGRMLQQAVTPAGHRFVSLWVGNDGRPWLVHQLVLMAFAGPCPSGQEGCHEDGNPDNNHRSNLYWGSRSQNMLDAVRHGTHNNTRKTHCPRDHRLDLPNLVASEWAEGLRECLACRRAHGLRYYYARQGRDFDVDAAADRNYRKIMGAAA